ncbi:MAG: M48 family metalloprotease, partial [bacterium]
MKPQTLVIPFEKKLREDIFSTLKGDIITKILEEAKTDKRENVYKHLLEGYSFKLSPEISEFLYNLIEEVRKSLEFDEKVDYYIDNSAESNAYCITKDEDDESHILVLHSRLIETMSEDELKFVIGHEFGHLINDNNKIKRVVDFVFPGEPPLVLHHKLKLW